MIKFFVLAFLLTGELRTDDWVTHFEWSVQRLATMSTEKYLHPQPSLAALLSTGKGNCVAWGKLGAAIALRRGCTVQAYTLLNSKGARHRILLVRRGKLLWMLSCWDVVRVRSVADACVWLPGDFRVERWWALQCFKEVLTDKGPD